LDLAAEEPAIDWKEEIKINGVVFTRERIWKGYLDKFNAVEEIRELGLLPEQFQEKKEPWESLDTLRQAISALNRVLKPA
jgi:hypothetical protein